MAFNLANIEETSGSLYLTPGVHEVIIESFEFGKDRFNNDVIKMKFKSTSGNESLETELRANQEVSQGKEKSALDMSLLKVRHIARAIIGEEGLINLTGNTVEELVGTFNQFLTNKAYRQKFGGEQVISASGKDWDKAVVPMHSTKSPMAEAISDQPTNLTYDKENPYDYRRKTTATTVPSPTPVPTGINIPGVPPHVR